MDIPPETKEVLATATDSWKRAFIIVFMAVIGFSCHFLLMAQIEV